GLPEFTPAPIARRVSEPQMRRGPESMGAERPSEKTGVDRGDKVVPLVSGPSTARATSVRLQKMLNTHGSSHGNGVAPGIEIPATRVETPAAVVEPTARLTLREAIPVPAAKPAAASARQSPEPRVSFAEIAKELLGTSAPAPRLDAPAVIPRPAVEEIT